MTTRHPDGPVPWDKAVAYAERKGLRGEPVDVFWTVIRKMDAAERRWQIENMKREAGDG